MRQHKTQTWVYVRSDDSTDISRLIRIGRLIPASIDFVVLDFVPTSAGFAALARAGDPFRYLAITNRTDGTALVQRVLAGAAEQPVQFFVADSLAARVQDIIRQRQDDLATSRLNGARHGIIRQNRLMVSVIWYWLQHIVTLRAASEAVHAPARTARAAGFFRKADRRQGVAGSVHPAPRSVGEG